MVLASEDGPQVAACEMVSQDPEGSLTCRSAEAPKGEEGEAGIEEAGEFIEAIKVERPEPAKCLSAEGEVKLFFSPAKYRLPSSTS